MKRKFFLKQLSLIIIFLSLFILCTVNSISAKSLPFLLRNKDKASVSAKKPFSYKNDRIRVSVDFSLIEPLSKNVRMKATLPDRNIILKKDRIEKRGADNYTWFGRVERKKLSTVVITVVGKSAIGYININGDSYSLEPESNDYIVIKNDVKKMLPFDLAPMVPKIGKKSKKIFAEALAAEDGSKIDVLVLYTQQMVDTYGSANLNAIIQNFVDLTNQGYSNSGLTTPRLNLVYSELYNDSNAAEGIKIDSALNYITNDSNIASKRNTYNADLVSLLRHLSPSDHYCGIAWIMQTVNSSFSDHAFSVVEVKKASEGGPFYCRDLTFAHELGHNMGCQHDRANAGGQSGAYPYSYGYSFFVPSLSQTFGTIMSYEGTTIPYFSNPNINYNGIPTGLDENDPNSAYNAKTIDNTKVVISNFEISSSPSTTSTTTSTTTTIPSTTTTSTTTSTTTTTVLASCYGDVSGNLTISSYDAALVAQYSVGLITEFPVCIGNPAKCLEIGDVSGNFAISSYDAALIAQYSVGLITAFPVGTPVCIP